MNKDDTTMTRISKEMKAFVSALFGNDGWIKLVEARFLRLRQAKQEHEYDPKDHAAVKVYVHGDLKPTVPHLLDELPTHSSDQFGSVLTGTDIIRA